MLLKIEIDPDRDEEIVIRAKGMSDELTRLQNGISSLLSKSGEISVRSGDDETFLSPSEILFAEISGGKTFVHTVGNVFSCSYRLHELEEMLPKTFVKASKGCLVNTSLIRALSRTPTGIGEAGFSNSNKKIYISRMYFRGVRDKIEETRLSK